jgi:GT2 family glycosyltransferase
MTFLPTVSVIVVSWQRPANLRRCLVALQQQDHRQIELCLVADPDTGAAAAAAWQAAGWTGQLAGNPGGNISVARNIGLGMARGDLVAFIDDDAVAEPTWAGRLAAAFTDPTVVAATGHTRGRNGISWQWTASEVDATGLDHALPVTKGMTLHQGTPQRAVKPVGTNCAFRRAALMQAGGFDPAYRFYLEDADIGLRLAALGRTAVVPGAVVHHAFAASDRRRADRVPTDLHQIGASSMVFLRRHADPSLWPEALGRLRVEQADRLTAHRKAGRINTAEVARLTGTLESGIRDGEARLLETLLPLHDKTAAFAPLPGTGPRPGRIIAGRIWQARRLRAKATRAAAAGEVVTLILLSPTARPHRHRFDQAGFWEQSGGLFGPSDRSQPRFRWWRFATRIAAETTRIAPFRPT